MFFLFDRCMDIQLRIYLNRSSSQSFRIFTYNPKDVAEFCKDPLAPCQVAAKTLQRSSDPTVRSFKGSCCAIRSSSNP